MSEKRLTRPYRVGMARPQQQIIEPDEIYYDMARGAPTRIPREFPYTWNPVNGVDGVGGVMEDIFASVVSAGQQAGKTVVSEQGAKAVEDALKTAPGRALLQAVEEKAAAGVTEVVKKNAPNLILLAVAGGAIGGVISQKLGKTGTVLALLVAGWAGNQILTAQAPKKK